MDHPSPHPRHHPGQPWTVEEALAAGRTFVAIHDRLPTTSECRGGNLPSVEVLRRLFTEPYHWLEALRTPAPDAQTPVKVFTCLQCGQGKPELRRYRRICQRCRNRSKDTHIKRRTRDSGEPDATWMNGEVPLRAWVGFQAQPLFIHSEDE